ncbi:MAG TPA: 50S ribosomal protein L9 [Gemmatimonadales bacterium]|nr:50S ribosomal protein L9 [Gemmatimonadales bacterium]
MEVILREDVKALGKAGELVKVKIGYARNYLLPRGLAYEATDGNKKRIAAETKARTTRLAAERSGAEALATQLRGLVVTLIGKAGEEGRLFGSITTHDISDALAKLGHTVDKRRIELEHPIKTLGDHMVPVKLHPDVVAEIRVSVVQG